IDQIIDRTLRLLDELHKWQDELSVLGEQAGDLARVGQPARVGRRNNLVRFVHRWWLLSGGNKCSPDDTHHPASPRSTTVFFNLPLPTGHHPLWGHDCSFVANSAGCPATASTTQE